MASWNDETEWFYLVEDGKENVGPFSTTEMENTTRTVASTTTPGYGTKAWKAEATERLRRVFKLLGWFSCIFSITTKSSREQDTVSPFQPHQRGKKKFPKRRQGAPRCCAQRRRSRDKRHHRRRKAIFPNEGTFGKAYYEQADDNRFLLERRAYELWQ